MADNLKGHFHDSFIESGEFDLISRTVANVFSGFGTLVDAGCFLGTSTRALIEGLLLSGKVAELDKPIFAIDRFTISDDYIYNHFLARGIDYQYEESFLPLFLENLQDHLSLIEVRAGDLLRVGRLIRPIEILHNDVAKSAPLNAYIIKHWFPLLIPEHSRIIQQDFYTPAQPWIAISMAALLDYFDVEVSKVGESCVFSLKRHIPPSALAAARTADWTSAGSISLLDAMCERVSRVHESPLRLMQCLCFHFQGERDQALSLLGKLLNLDPPPQDVKWVKWLGLAMLTIGPDSYSERSLLGEAYFRWVRGRLGGDRD